MDDNDRTFNDPNEFVNILYEPLSQTLAEAYQVSVSEIQDIFSQDQLVNDLIRFSEVFNYETDAFIEGLVEIVRQKYGNSKISDYLREILVETSHDQDNPNFDIKGYFDEKIGQISNEDYFDEIEREILLNSLNIFKYSYAMWRDNV